MDQVALGTAVALSGARRARLWAFVIGALALLAIAFDFPQWLRGPAPYPPEWQWERRLEPPAGSLAPALWFALGVLALIAAASSRRISTRPRSVLALGVLLGWGFSLGLVSLEPGGALATLARRALSRTVTSYLTVAASEDARDPRAFLERHHTLLEGYRKSAKHAATHPPGPVLFYRGLIAWADASPKAAEAVVRVAGMRTEGDRPQAPSLSTRCAAVLGPLLITLCAAAAAFPIAALGRSLGLDPSGSIRLGLLWLLVPGQVLQTPHFDQALALPVTAAVALLAWSVTSTGSGTSAAGSPFRSLAFAAAAGLCGGLALFFSYGQAAILAIGGSAALLAIEPRWRLALRSATLAFATAAAAFFSSVLVGHSPLSAALTALAIHREAYTAPRSYALWLAFNPVDLFVFLGPAVAVLFLFALRASVRASRPFSTAAGRFNAVAAVGLALLLLSGTLRGEAGRVLVPLMPVLLVSTLAPLQLGRPSSEGPLGRFAATGLAALQAATAMLLRWCWEVY